MHKQSLKSYIARIFFLFWGHFAFRFLGMPPTYIQHFCYSKGCSHISALVKCAHPFDGRRHTEIWILQILFGFVVESPTAQEWDTLHCLLPSLNTRESLELY